MAKRTRHAPVAARSPRRKPRAAPARAPAVTASAADEIEVLRRELERATTGMPGRWNADPEDVQRSVAQLVLTLVEFVRKLLERQAIRRLEAGTLDDQQIEDLGRALMTLEKTIRDIAAKFGIATDELNLDLGPLGKLI